MGHTDDTMRAIGKIIMIMGRMTTNTTGKPQGAVAMGTLVRAVTGQGIARKQNAYRIIRAMERMQLVEQTSDGFEYADRRYKYIRLTEHGLADYRDQTATTPGTGPTAA